MKEKKFVSVVVYLHNAASYLEKFLSQVVTTIDGNFEKMELVFVDDACVDGTMDILHQYVEKNNVSSMVNVIHMSFFHGLESSMNAGRDLAIGDFVYEFDDIIVDYDTETIINVYEKMLDGVDVVAASSDCKKRFTSLLFYNVYNKTSRNSGKIGQETFRIISRRAINRIKTMNQYIPYRKAAYASSGLKTAVIDYKSTDRKLRIKNKKSSGERAGLALDSFIYFTNALERISAIVSMVFLFVTVGMGIYLITDALSQDKPVEGWLSTMGFMALGFFGIFALLTIILKYLSVMLGLIFKKQRYLIEDIEKIVK